MEGKNWFFKPDRWLRFHGDLSWSASSLSAEAGLNLPPLGISCSWPPSPESAECLMFTGLIYFEAIFFTDGFFLVKGSCLLIEEVSLAKHTCHRGRYRGLGECQSSQVVTNYRKCAVRNQLTNFEVTILLLIYIGCCTITKIHLFIHIKS